MPSAEVYGRVKTFFLLSFSRWRPEQQPTEGQAAKPEQQLVHSHVRQKAKQQQQLVLRHDRHKVMQRQS
ncbi:uncharacterized protein PITG_06486 [Phytophthora infestans T30-4]|uniref:Uncharacterized protein n=1 Tax=Phytophthora infestans (strain T30-4) TaxID=403677 RepID=D0N4Y9_PHYIT|nr:uncharacterized protein PITG_06486 [Phytophthora infestans T30-4]EEY69947.1 hypothetical protein PITG_06486 [Phytophthora infestans T30-4]|eukprot:XP_002998594.1 hypothetical protein PITG_06486 [Phytophthora infestans T30-4]